MALKAYQTVLTLGKLYKVNKKGAPSGAGEQIVPNLYVNSGSVDVYVHNGATQPAARANMVLEDTGLTGVEAFEIIPTYISIIQNAGTTTELVVSGLEVEDLGVIS